MLTTQSSIYFSDNSAAKEVKLYFIGKKECISQLDVAQGSVKQAVSYGGQKRNRRIVEKHNKVKLVVISTKKSHTRKNGLYVTFPETRGLIINDGKLAKAVPTSISGFYPKELKVHRKFKVFANSLSSGMKQKNLSNQNFFPI